MVLRECELNLDRNNMELKPHGTPDFPCAGYVSQHNGTEENICWHWHEEMELLYVASGSLKLQIPGRTFHLKTGDCFFINANILHYAAAEPCCKIYSLVFHPLLITGQENSVYAQKYMTPLNRCTALGGCLLNSARAWEQTVTNDFMIAFEAVSLDRPGYEFTVREKLSHICFFLYQQHEQIIGAGNAEQNEDNIRVRKMLCFIREHYSENLSLSQIAKSADIGERECLRCFQRVIQISPMQYLIKYRITQGAAILLRNVTCSIADSSIQCGFDSPSNFSMMFKRFYKCTPREYRKRALANHIG